MDKNEQHLTGLPAGWMAKDLRFLLQKLEESEDRERRIQLAGRGMVWREPVPVAAQAAA